MGFGHRVYKNFDPRAKIIKKACFDVLERLGVQQPSCSRSRGARGDRAQGRLLHRAQALPERRLLLGRDLQRDRHAGEHVHGDVRDRPPAGLDRAVARDARATRTSRSGARARSTPARRSARTCRSPSGRDARPTGCCTHAPRCERRRVSGDGPARHAERLAARRRAAAGSATRSRPPRCARSHARAGAADARRRPHARLRRRARAATRRLRRRASSGCGEPRSGTTRCACWRARRRRRPLVQPGGASPTSRAKAHASAPLYAAALAAARASRRRRGAALRRRGLPRRGRAHATSSWCAPTDRCVTPPLARGGVARRRARDRCSSACRAAPRATSARGRSPPRARSSR